MDELASGMWNFNRRSLEPLTNVSETENKVIVEVDLPLVKKEDIHLRIVEAGLEIEASLTKCMQFERWGTVQRSCEFTSFYKLLPLSSPVVAEGSKATFTRGILRVELRKKKAAEYKIWVD